MSYIEEVFSTQGKVALITGGAGVLSAAIAEGLGKAGAAVVVTDISSVDARVADLREKGIRAVGYTMNALKRAEIEEVASRVRDEFGRLDILVNTAGGNSPQASTSDTTSFFDIPADALLDVVSLNLFGGAILPSQVFGKMMLENDEGGVIVNFSSPAAFQPLTRVPAYSASKAAVSNFTQWLAVYIATECSPKVRVNAIAPGFCLTNQNRYLLLDDRDELTPRGQSVIAHTPAGRFGDPQDLVSTILWLASPASSFVTGAVIPVDGGFTAFSGV